jgi:hypothetical protein
MNIYTFQMLTTLNLPSREAIPIVSERNWLIGSVVRHEGDVAKGFIDGTGHLVATEVSTGGSFYLHPVLNNGVVVAFRTLLYEPAHEDIKVAYATRKEDL